MMPVPPRLRCCAFTLIEVLVVIAIIAILISLMLPGLGYVRETARMVKAQSDIRQQMVAYTAYTYDFRDKTLPAAPHWNWAHGTGRYSMEPGDPFSDQYMAGSIAKIWTWHFIAATEYTLSQVQTDRPTYQAFWERSRQGSESGRLIKYGAHTFQTALAYHPSFGMNGVFVGGAYTHGAFRSGRPGPNPTAAGGDFYITDVSTVRHPSTLLVFCSSRGGDVREGSWWGWGAADPNHGTIRPGYWMVTPPRRHPRGRGSGSYMLGGGWHESNAYDARQPAGRWGMVEPRYFQKAVTVMFDGHVRMQTLEDLRDMRKWSNFATSPDWDFEPAP